MKSHLDPFVRNDPEPQTQSQIITESYIDPKTSKLTQRRYMKGAFLGKGGFAKVYEFTNLDAVQQKMQAAKIIPKENLTKARQKKKLESEIKIHRSLHHENIVKFEHYFEDELNVYILMELCTASLNEKVKRRKRLTEVEVKCYGV
jgi:polo-like kinase 1